MGRHKPGKPRRERPASGPDEHVHDALDIPDDFDHDGRPVDNRLLGGVMSAAYDGCRSCQDPLLTLLVEDSGTTARLVELACIQVHDMFGGLPSSLTDPDAPGLAAPEFRRLAALGVDGGNDKMWQACADMSATERRAAANTALDQLIGALPR